MKLLLAGSAIVQLGLIVVCYVLTILCDTRAGVMRHIYYRSGQFSHGLLSDVNLKFLSFLLLASIVMAIYLKVRTKQRSRLAPLSWGMFIITTALLLVVVNSPYFQSLDPYYYYIIAGSICWILQGLTTLYVYRRALLT